MKNLSPLKLAGIAFVLGILLVLTTFWCRLNSSYPYYFAIAVGAFGLTHWLLSFTKGSTKQITSVATGLFLGFSCLIIAVTCGHASTLQKLMLDVAIVLANVILASISYRWQSWWALLIAFIINILIMTFIVPWYANLINFPI